MAYMAHALHVLRRLHPHGPTCPMPTVHTRSNMPISTTGSMPIGHASMDRHARQGTRYTSCLEDAAGLLQHALDLLSMRPVTPQPPAVLPASMGNALVGMLLAELTLLIKKCSDGYIARMVAVPWALTPCPA